MQREIAAFGGDPGRVTLMGESAGAVNVYALLTSPLLRQARPALFHRAVALSDGESLHVDWPFTPADSAKARAAPELGPAPLSAEEQTTFAAPSTPSLGTSVPLPNDLQAWLDQQERDILIRALRETGFNRTATAARLGISLRQIRYRIARLNIAAPGDQDAHDDAR